MADVRLVELHLLNAKSKFYLIEFLSLSSSSSSSLLLLLLLLLLFLLLLISLQCFEIYVLLTQEIIKMSRLVFNMGIIKEMFFQMMEYFRRLYY